MDWDNSYYTMSDENNYTIWHFLKKLWGEGKVYRGSDVVPWSGRSGTSYSQMEIIEIKISFFNYMYYFRIWR